MSVEISIRCFLALFCVIAANGCDALSFKQEPQCTYINDSEATYARLRSSFPPEYRIKVCNFINGSPYFVETNPVLEKDGLCHYLARNIERVWTGEALYGYESWNYTQEGVESGLLPYVALPVRRAGGDSCPDITSEYSSGRIFTLSANAVYFSEYSNYVVVLNLINSKSILEILSWVNSNLKEPTFLLNKYNSTDLVLSASIYSRLDNLNKSAGKLSLSGIRYDHKKNTFQLIVRDSSGLILIDIVPLETAGGFRVVEIGTIEQ